MTSIKVEAIHDCWWNSNFQKLSENERHETQICLEKLSFIMLLEQAEEDPEIEFHKKENNINPQQFFSETTKTTLNTPFKK